MNQKIIYWYAVLAICGSVNGNDQEKPTESQAVPIAIATMGKPISLSLTLTNIGKAIRRFNPDLGVARIRVDEARARLLQAGLLRNPEVSTGFDHDPAFREIGGSIGFSQSFPLTARLRLEKDVSRIQIAVAKAEVGDVERQITGKARLVAVEYLALQQQKQLRVRQLQLATELADYLTTNARKGEGSSLDAAQAKLEANQLELEIRQFDTEARQLIGSLKPLIGLAPVDILSLTGSFAQALVPQMNDLDLKERNDYVAAQLSVIAAGREVKLEESKRWEDITAGLFASFSREEDAPNGLEAEQRIGFELSIPLPIWNKNRGAIKERSVRMKRLEMSVVALANRIRNEVMTAYDAMSDQSSLANEIQTRLMPDANQQVTKTTTAYRDGLVDLLTVLRARDQQLNLQAAHLGALRNFNLARVRYETALGKQQ